MKYANLFCCLLFSISCFSQIDSLTIQKENRFKVAGSVIANSILSVPGDFSEMGHNISSNWQRTALYGAGILGLIAVDKHTTGFWHDTVEPNINYSLPNIELFDKSSVVKVDRNSLYFLYPIIGLYASSFAINNKKGQVVALNAAKSVAYSYVISHLLLKTITARNRPHRRLNDDNPTTVFWTRDQWDFGNFHPVYFDSRGPDAGGKGNSFPSFHATFYFSVAKVFQMEYNNYWIPYGVATAVFFANVKSHNHWVSDLAAAGVVGTIIGRSVVKSSRKQMAKSNLATYNPKKISMTKQFIPQISNKIVGLHFIGQF